MLFKLVKLIALASSVAFSGVDAQSDDCLQLKDCLAKLASFAGVPFENFGNWDAELCEALVPLYGPQGIAAICASVVNIPDGRKLTGSKRVVAGLAADPPVEDEVFMPGRHLQTCPLSFQPAYGEDETSGGYDTYVASIVGTFIMEGKKNRTGANEVGAYYIGWAAAKIAAAATTGIPGVELAAQVALNAYEVVIDQIGYQDGDIDSAEIEAAYENTKTIISQACGISTAISIFQTDTTTRFNTVDQTLIDLKSYAEFRFNEVDVSIDEFRTDTTNRFNTVDGDIFEFRNDVTTRFDTVDFNIQEFRVDMTARFDVVDTTLVDLKIYLTERLDTVEAILEARFDSVDATLSSRFDQLDRELSIVRTLLITPEGRKTAWNKQGLICDGIETSTGNCPTVPNFP